MTTHDMSTFLDENGHVPAADMARYIDGTCDRVTRVRVTRHLADCEECRQELTAIRRLVPRRVFTTTRVGTLLGLAAAVTFVTLGLQKSSTIRSVEPVSDGMRAIVTEIDAEIPVAAPMDDAFLPVDSVVLTWRPVGGDAEYHVMLQDAGGGVVYSTKGSDTSTVVPASAFKGRADAASEKRATTYFWSVEARLLDGRSVNTGVHRFRVR